MAKTDPARKERYDEKKAEVWTNTHANRVSQADGKTKIFKDKTKYADLGLSAVSAGVGVTRLGHGVAVKRSPVFDEEDYLDFLEARSFGDDDLDFLQARSFEDDDLELFW